MKRSEINAAICEDSEAFKRHGWALPPNPKWDVTDFGLGDFKQHGLVLINLSEQTEYCEKLMYVAQDQITPMHHHQAKKEDIICRYGQLAIQLSKEKPSYRMQVNGQERDIPSDTPLILQSGERITLTQGAPHAFWAKEEYAIVGEVSTANDDQSDNYFQNKDIGRFSEIEEDEPALVQLVSD